MIRFVDEDIKERQKRMWLEKVKSMFTGKKHGM